MSTRSRITIMTNEIKYHTRVRSCVRKLYLQDNFWQQRSNFIEKAHNFSIWIKDDSEEWMSNALVAFVAVSIRLWECFIRTSGNRTEASQRQIRKERDQDRKNWWTLLNRHLEPDDEHCIFYWRKTKIRNWSSCWRSTWSCHLKD